MKTAKTLFENRIAQFALVLGLAAILIFGGSKIESRELANDVVGATDARSEIEIAAEKVKSARDEYFAAIGKNNSGAYDQYLDAANCPEKLDRRLVELKNLRNDLQRLAGEIALRERENTSEILAAEISKVESEMQNLADAAFSESELAALESRELDLRVAFQSATSAVENCAAANANELANCESALVEWVVARENYENFALKFANEAAERQLKLESQLAPLQKQLDELEEENTKANFVPQLSAVLDAQNLRAGILDTIANVSTTVRTAVGSVISAPLTAVNGVISGATSALSAGTNAVATALGAPTSALSALSSSQTVFDGDGAISGLQTFKSTYKGNSYGSAIGAITGWTNFALPFVGVIAIAVIIYAGFLYLTAAGNEEQTKKAKNIIIWVVIGIILIFSAYAIVNTLLSTNSSSGGGGTSVGVNVGGVGVNYSN